MGKEIKLSKSYIIKEIEIGGLNVKIEVNSDNHGGWILEIVDTQSNAIIREEIYPSAKLAIQAGVRAIKEGGVKGLMAFPC